MLPFPQNYPTTNPTNTIPIPTHNTLSTPLLPTTPDFADGVELGVVCVPKHSSAFRESSSVEFLSALDIQVCTFDEVALVVLQYR
jgi:hypothetical protein